ncbi:hypothetical protein SARC_05078 [Sphaeroforma arctica JP610]|uniref:Uncharacterized protein n=1 Tax=Sphaeroforma arctica JP610 TaxID=667725 RepID=A0A0L0G386_9EUKA|nr:hypothetical protein SARC_05078 [Sphaeroforma arctica JP610]KNC82638.1 hypothetical protein SARC_05078 [Sphaeroforma arctica JP610]|eukprot:XP_014156540.1 hypothetical protein SARC_05078 [Sphaeroforma arctica JP610]
MRVSISSYLNPLIMQVVVGVTVFISVTISSYLNPLMMLYLVTVTVVLGVLSYMGVSLDKTTISRAKRFGAKKWT